MHKLLISMLALTTIIGATHFVPSIAHGSNLPELLIKHRDAIGGTDAIEAIQTVSAKLHFSMLMLEGEMDIYQLAPDKQFSKLETGIINYTEASDGNIRWKLDQNGQITSHTEELKLQAPANVVADYQYLFPNDEITVTDQGTEEYEGKTYRILAIDAPGYKKAHKKYLDPETFLCIHEETEESGITVMITSSDFRETNGITAAWKTVQQPKIPGMPPSTVTVKELAYNDTVDENIFNPPTSEEKDYTFSGADQVTVPMKLHGDHLVVGVMLNGKGPYDFILDSGAAATIIDNEFADEMGLERKEGMHAVGVGGAEAMDNIVVDELALGDFKIDTVSMFCMDMKMIAEMLGMKDSFKGIVGFDLFARAVMKLDYQNQELTIIDPEKFNYDGPGKPVEGKLSNNLICVNGVIDGDIEALIRVDTGAAGGLHLHSGYLREHGYLDRYKGDVEMDFFGAGGKQTIQLVKVKTLQLGDFIVKEPMATLMQSKEGDEGIMGTLDAAATVGNSVLSRFVIFFDYDNNRLILEPTEAMKRPSRLNRAGLMLVEDNENRIIVAAVLAGSPAEDAGFETGDEVIQMEKLKAGKGLTADLANRMLFASEGVTFDFKVRRNDNTKRLELTLRDLVK